MQQHSLLASVHQTGPRVKFTDEGHEAQILLDDILEKMMEAIDAGDAIDSKLFQEAEEQIKELEVSANTLRKDLEKLQKQEPQQDNYSSVP